VNNVRELIKEQTHNTSALSAVPELPSPSPAPNPTLMLRLREYLLQPGAPNARLHPGWLAQKLDVDERELLGALAYAVRDGLVEMHWEVHCPFCSLSPAEFDSLRKRIVGSSALPAIQILICIWTGTFK
jgi:hypothetical protein